MNPRVKNVKPENNYMLRVGFTNGETGLFDVKPYLNFGIFSELKDNAVFNSVFADGLGIEWANEASSKINRYFCGLNCLRKLSKTNNYCRQII